MRTLSLAAIILTFALSNAALSQTQQTVRTISVTGTVETKLAPGHIVWHISLRDTNTDMSLAKSASDKKVKAVLALKRKLDINNGDIETGIVSIGRETEYDEKTRTSHFKHFRVTRSITIRQRNLKRFDEYLDAFVDSAEMSVSFSYASSELHETRAEIRLEALKAAKKKAKDMAEVVGAKVGNALTINEHASGGNPAYGGFGSNGKVSNREMANFAIGGESGFSDLASDKFIPGAITVKMTVYVTFELE